MLELVELNTLRLARNITVSVSETVNKQRDQKKKLSSGLITKRPSMQVYRTVSVIDKGLKGMLAFRKRKGLVKEIIH